MLLSRENLHVSHKKLRWLYREERLQVRRRGGRNRALGTRALMVLTQGSNQRLSMDFFSDTLMNGRRFRIQAMVDDYTRECLCLVADTSLSGLRVARELDHLIARRDRPHSCVSDNCTELTKHGAATLVADERRGLGLYRTRQAHPERLHREL